MIARRQAPVTRASCWRWARALSTFSVEGRIVDLHKREIYKGRVNCADGRISSLVRDENVTAESYLLPGFVDAHVHIESSLLVPSEFARLAVCHGNLLALLLQSAPSTKRTSAPALGPSLS